jgi:cobalt/nickel transport system permease protein
MHITEGIITGAPAVAYTMAGVALVGWGVKGMKRFAQKHPEKKPLLGMAGAFIFFMSLLPIPAFTGTCSHPCGSPLAAIIMGPAVGIALTGISLLLQAAFFAHGGFSTWGANVIALGFFGCVFGWGTYQFARKAGLSIRVAGFLGGLIGDIMVYVASGLILGVTLSHSPSPQFSLGEYLSVIYLAYFPTQAPIAISEMLLTGFFLHYVYCQRPDVLQELNVAPIQSAGKTGIALLAVGAFATTLFMVNPVRAEDKATQVEASSSFSGMDETVNEHLAEQAGRPARAPYIDTESMGDIWNGLLLITGGICGFIIRGGWDKVFVNKRNSKSEPKQAIKPMPVAGK